MKTSLFYVIALTICLVSCKSGNKTNGTMFNGSEIENVQPAKENIADYFMPTSDKMTIVLVNQKTGKVDRSGLRIEKQIRKDSAVNRYVLEQKSYMDGNHLVAEVKTSFTCTDSTIIPIESKAESIFKSDSKLKKLTGYLLKLPPEGKTIQWTINSDDDYETIYVAYFKIIDNKKMLLVEKHIPLFDPAIEIDYYEKNVGYVQTTLNGKVSQKRIE